MSLDAIIKDLERDPLRNIVLLKHLEAFPGRTRAHRVADEHGSATLVLFDVAGGAYDRRTYPTASFAALVSSESPALTLRLMRHVPPHVGVVFKLASDADRDAVASVFKVRRTTSVLSYTSTTRFEGDAGVGVTRRPGDGAFAMFEAQGHARTWLEPLLDADRAFACVLEEAGQPAAACFAFENYQRVWEIGGVVTLPEFRRRGLAARVVRTAVAELASHGAVPRYQVEEANAPSIRLARSIGLELFLTVTHFLRSPDVGH